MNEANFWVFISIILRSETSSICGKIYKIIKMVVKNLLMNQGNLQVYLNETLIGLIGQGLEINNVNNVMHCLQIFDYIYHYCDINYKGMLVLSKWINDFDINTSL